MKVINNLPVVILAGGQARRMGGQDKALIKVQDRPLLSHVLEKISGFASPIGLNINKNFDLGISRTIGVNCGSGRREK